MFQRYRFLLEAIAIIAITVAIGVVVAFYFHSFPSGETHTPVVINEVYPAYLSDDPAPHQWFELLNRTGKWMTLEGWSVEITASNRLSLPTIVLPPHGYAVVAGSRDQFLAGHSNYPGLVVSAENAWPGLNRKSDFLVLRDAQRQPVDAVNWGSGSKGPADARLWTAPSFGSGAPWLLKSGQVAADHSLERRPAGVDHDGPGDFIRQPFPSPGTVNIPAGGRPDYLLFISWTNVVSVAGGILLWIAFVYIALIARRFEALTQQRTLWQAMLVVPIGILVYSLFQAYGFLTRGSMLLREQWWGFLALFVSALLCAGLVFLFRRRAKGILEG